MKSIFITLLGAFLMLAAARGQSEIVVTEFVTLSFNGSVPGYYYRTGKEVEKLEASRQGISEPVSYRGAGVLSLYENASDLAPRKRGDAIPKPALQVRLPTGHDRVLLLFSFPDKKQSVPEIRALGISTSKMKEGDYRIFNYAKQTVYTALNDEKAAVPAGKSVTLSSSAWRRNVLDMNVKFGIRKNNKPHVVYSSVWGHRPVRRVFLFIFARADKYRPLDVRMFHDVPKIKAGS